MKTAQERNLLAEAKELGLEARFHHIRPTYYRYYRSVTGTPLMLEVADAKGGTTVCNLCRVTGTTDDGHRTYEVVVAGVAKCNAKDTFNKGIGRVIALGRAMQNLKEQTA